jgi:hypothetical protein
MRIKTLANGQDGLIVNLYPNWKIRLHNKASSNSGIVSICLQIDVARNVNLAKTVEGFIKLFLCGRLRWCDINTFCKCWIVITHWSLVIGSAFHPFL